MSSTPSDPIYDPRDAQVPRLLASAYRRSLEVALENGITSIAFPAISTGVFGYPVELAAPIAFHTIIDFCQKQTQIVLVRYVLFGSDALAQHKNALRAGASERDLVLMED
ncbi:MAG: macro domain-containing protein [Ilumatobacteraceae bacterium]